MNFPYSTEWPQFFTASIYQRLPLLNNDQYKKIITDSLKFLVNNKRINLFAFVIMNNHIHLIWQPLSGSSLASVQHSFMKFTAQQIKFRLAAENNYLLAKCRVEKIDREYQIWQRKPLGIELYSEKVFIQKLNYIHYNPVKANLCRLPEMYYFSSARFYENGIDEFDMLTHFAGS